MINYGTKMKLKEAVIFFKAWSEINKRLAHEIYLEMNSDNFVGYIKNFDILIAEKWARYSALN